MDAAVRARTGRRPPGAAAKPRGAGAKPRGAGAKLGRLAGLSIVALALLGPATVAAPSARANEDVGSCQANLVDSAGGTWHVGDHGQVYGGQMAFNEYGVFTVNGIAYGPPPETECSLEQGGREVVFPWATQGLVGLQISRRVFVPAEGEGFARWLDAIENLRDVPTRATFAFGGSMASGQGTRVVATTSGDRRALPDNAWAVLDDAFRADSSDWYASTAHLWDSASPLKRSGMTAAAGGPADGSGWVGAVYSVVLAPRQRIVFMHVAAQRRTATDALAFVRANAGGSQALYAGISAEQLASLENWPAVTDADADGIPDAQDNCPGVSSSDRGDLDGDGQGDACDGDIDGDGLTNATELELGSQPRNPDSDGDGVRDGVDLCPRRAGVAPDGCPAVASVLPAPPPPALAPPAAVDRAPAVGRDRAAPRLAVRAPQRVSLAGMLQGTRLRVACDERCWVTARLLAAVRSDGLRPQARSGYNHTLVSAQLAPASGERPLTLAPCVTRAGRSAPCLRRMRRWLLPARPLRLSLEVVARDAAGNATTRRLRLDVR